jgi:hypothetical protein
MKDALEAFVPNTYRRLGSWQTLHHRVNKTLESCLAIISDCSPSMKMSSETKKALSVIFIYLALLFFLIGMAAQLKSDFHSRAEISTAGFTVAAVLVALGAISFLFSLSKKQG